MGRGVGNIIYQSLFGPVERYTVCLWQPEFGPEETILFLEISRGFLYIFRRKEQQSCDGWAA
jgi:hypothetical protein